MPDTADTVVKCHKCCLIRVMKLMIQPFAKPASGTKRTPQLNCFMQRDKLAVRFNNKTRPAIKKTVFNKNATAGINTAAEEGNPSIACVLLNILRPIMSITQ